MNAFLRQDIKDQITYNNVEAPFDPKNQLKQMYVTSIWEIP